MRDLKRWDFITRLSFLVLLERDGKVEGREMSPLLEDGVVAVGVDFEEALVRMEGRFLGAVGACVVVSILDN